MPRGTDQARNQGRSTGLARAVVLAVLAACLTTPMAFAAGVVPPESPVYGHIDKLATMGFLPAGSANGKPLDPVAVARMLAEAERAIEAREKASAEWGTTLFTFVPPRKPDPALISAGREQVAKGRAQLPREALDEAARTQVPATAAGGSDISRRSPSSANIPLNSPIYGHLDKLAGMGFITSDVRGLRPYSRAEAARLTDEAIRNLAAADNAAPSFAWELVARLRELVPRELFLKENPAKEPPLFDVNPAASIRATYAYLDGVPRDYRRPGSIDPKAAFGFIGGNLTNGGLLYTSGTEGTPLVENNNGVIYRRGHNGEVRWAAEGYASDVATLLIEPAALVSGSDATLRLNRAYAKLGGGGLELEVGRDENWFGPGYRGALTLSSNARNFDQVKLSSPEPLDVAWVRRWLGEVKYALVLSRFDSTDEGTPDHRQPWFVGIKLALKPYDWFEYGINFVRQEGGPGFSGTTGIQDFFFGGGNTNHSNSIAGIDLRFRIPWLRNTELYGEYVGEDSATFWPVDESYLAGVYVPCLTRSCRDDLRFELFWASSRLYTDGKFPRGYTYHGMSPGHSQGGGSTQEFYLRYSHSFSPRNVAIVEYMHSDRGQENRVKVDSAGLYDPQNGTMQAMEHRDAGRVSWQLPVYGDLDAQILYGLEAISNLNLVPGQKRTNHLATFELRYRY